MPQNSVKATLILRNDSAANWASRNPVLAKGEIGAEIDTGLLKMGDGATSFNNLNYINEGKSGDGALITTVDNKLTVANYGYSYWEYDPNSLEEVEVVEPDLSLWPSNLELEVKNGVPRWVKPIGTYNKIEGKMNGILVTLPSNYNPQTYDAVTKNYVDNKVASSIASAEHLKRQVVSELPDSPAVNTIYMIKDNSVTGADKYKEYIVIEGVLTQIGDTSVDLSNYIQKITNGVSGNLVGVGADGSLIDTGIPASNVNQLNVATSLTLGGVRASNADNFINVDNLGQMYLNRVATDKLYVPQGSEFILNGGGA